MSLKLKIILAFAAIYILWGSTNLAIKFSIETIPPFLMSGIRFLIAGGILFSIERLRGVPKPNIYHWRDALFIGALMLLIGNGFLTWAELTVPSGLASLIISTTPIWMILFDWWSPKGKRPKSWIFFGVILGFVGIFLLINPDRFDDRANVNWLGALALIIASISWSLGAILSKHLKTPSSPFITASIQMICGGVLLLVFAIFTGDWLQLNVSNISLKSILSSTYLMVAGSLIGFSSYIWLLQRCSPALVSTSSFVNPLLAVFLGWAIGGESITMKIVVAALIMVLAVVIITINNVKSGDHKVTLTSSDCEPVEEILLEKDENK